ncbi:phosphate ABC transporter permease subunit PstC [Culicoidibacter larvae]|nr:phosphate ABC transporter permease subunit PstC [Culicoidibacter larvae]
MNKRIRSKFFEYFWRNIFLIMATVSIVSVVGIGLFVFVNGSTPFYQPSMANPIVVFDGFTESNKVIYDGKQITKMNDQINTDDGEHTIQYTDAEGNIQTVQFVIDPTQTDTSKVVEFLEYPDDSKVDNSVRYSATLTLAGSTTLSPKEISVVAPEPPYSILSFLFGQEWRPDSMKLYGILPMIISSILVTICALLIGVPIGVLTGVYLAELAPPRVARVLRPLTELLAGIPSVVFGFIGLMVIVPFIQNTFQIATGTSALAASIVLGIMILPTVISMTETSLRAVPSFYKEGSLALGATQIQTIFKVQIRAAKSGILTGIVLGIGRAMGETMAVILVAGNSPQIPGSILDSVRTLTATIALEMGYASGRHSEMLFAIGIVLFVFIFILNVVVLAINKREAK